MLLFAAATKLFIVLMAVQAQSDTEAPSTVTLCANPPGQLTLAEASGCPANTTASHVVTWEGQAGATADLAAADAALGTRLDTLETTVAGLALLRVASIRRAGGF